MNENTNSSSESLAIQNLPIFSCHFLEFPDGGKDCSVVNRSLCVKCAVVSRFALGGEITDEGSFGPGYDVVFAEWIFTVLLGLFGMFSNYLIITVMPIRRNGNSFDLMLVALAVFDLIGSVTSIITTTAMIALYDNWGRGFWSKFIVFYAAMTCICARSGSSLMTCLITLERYLIITFPTKSSTWFTEKRTKYMIGFVYFFAIIVTSLPRFASYKIVSNEFRSVPTLQSFEYIIGATSFQPFWYKTMKGYFNAIDYWVPTPILVVLNSLLFFEIYKFTRKRRELNLKTRRDIRAVRMLIPVTVVLVLSNVVAWLMYYYIKSRGITYRELLVGLFLSIALNSSVNFPIYFAMRPSFRKDVKEVVKRMFRYPENEKGNKQIVSVTDTSKGGKTSEETF